MPTQPPPALANTQDVPNDRRQILLARPPSQSGRPQSDNGIHNVFAFWRDVVPVCHIR